MIVTEALSYGGRSGRVSAKATAINAGGMGWTQGFTWDELGNLASESYPQCTHANCTATALLARSQSYGYNRGMLVNVPTFADGITYHLNGLPATIDHANGVLDTIANDPKERPRPLSITTTGGSRNWPSGLYAYDAAGNLYAQGTDYFLYDSLSRITTSRLHDQPYDGGTEKKQSYSYDRYGNLLDVTTQVATGLPVTRTNATVATTNRLSLAGYDLAGNVTAWQGLSYGYDPFDSLRYGPNRVLIYGPGDERIWEFAYTNASDVNTWVETFTLRGLGGKVKREYRAAGGTGAGHWQVNRDHLHRGGELLATVLPQQGATYHYSLDHLGTPRLVTDQNAIKIAQHTYYPYGEEATNPNQDGERMKFTGHERDFQGAGTTDDLDYMHARYCSPMTGRFMSIDPLFSRRALRRPQAWNRYSYVIGNPLMFVDPSGQLWFQVGGQWSFLEGVTQITEYSNDSDGNLVITVTAGRDNFLTFDGGELTLYKEDGTKRGFPAVSGEVDGEGRTQPTLQGERRRGPIPEGRYTINPALVHSYDRHVSTLDKLAGLVGRGGWRGGRSTWGNYRVEVVPAPSTDLLGRDSRGFFIHGGAEPGSAGCIDLCSYADDFFSTLGNEPGSIDVDVDYP